MRKPDPSSRFARTAPASDAPAVTQAGRILAVAVAVVILWLVVRVSVANALLEVRPDVAAALSPNHPQPELAMLGGGRRTSLTERDYAAIRLLETAPLSHEPFLLAAQRAIQDGEADRVDPLLEEAIRRNPRSRAGHLLRLDRQLRENRVQEATVTVAVLSRLLPDSQIVLIDQLARMARDPAARSALARLIGGDRNMRTQVLEALARQGADPEILFSLARNGDAGEEGETPRWQTLMLDELVSSGQVDLAWQTWRRISGIQRPSDQVYDPGFEGLRGPPPFNWYFEGSAEGFAELARGGPGLYVEYYGRRNIVLGGQLLTLPANRYRLTFTVDGSADKNSGRLEWSVTCQSDGRTLATAPITDVNASPRTISATFTVPAECAAQWLRLTGSSAEFPKDQRVTIREIRVTKVDPS